MNSFYEKLQEQKTSFHTIEDWENGYYQLAQRILHTRESQSALEQIVLEKKGADFLENLYEKVSDTMVEEMTRNVMPPQEILKQYGYLKSGMTLLSSQQTAFQMLGQYQVYALHTDNTEKLITSVDEIRNHPGLFGVKTEDMESMAELSMQSIFSGFDIG